MLRISDLIPDFTGCSIDNGSLRLVEKLGTGAFAVVYRALTSPLTPTEYAVKCIKKFKAGSRIAESQKNEAQLHQLVLGPRNIVHVHRVLEDRGYIYIVMDLWTSGDLMSSIADRCLYYRKDEMLKQAFIQLIDAVESCHDKGVYHRDLKPGNMLCSEDGSEVTLADFGLATTQIYTEDFGLGSRSYTSPESRDESDTRIPFSSAKFDIWALGIVLVYMLTGRHPWRVAHPDDADFMQYVRNPDFFRDRYPLSQDADTILRRVLAPNPATRIELSELREEVLKAETFFMSDEDIVGASERVRRVADDCANKAGLLDSAGVSCYETAPSLIFSGPSASDPECEAPPTPQTPMACLPEVNAKLEAIKMDHAESFSVPSGDNIDDLVVIN